MGSGSDLVYRVVLGWRFGPVPNSCNFKLYTLQKVFSVDKEIRFDETSVRALLSDGKCKVTIREKRNGKTESCVVKFTITGYNEKGWATVTAEFEGKGEA